MFKGLFPNFMTSSVAAIQKVFSEPMATKQEPVEQKKEKQEELETEEEEKAESTKTVNAAAATEMSPSEPDHHNDFPVTESGSLSLPSLTSFNPGRLETIYEGKRLLPPLSPSRYMLLSQELPSPLGETLSVEEEKITLARPSLSRSRSAGF